LRQSRLILNLVAVSQVDPTLEGPDNAGTLPAAIWTSLYSADERPRELSALEATHVRPSNLSLAL
jgi:hypothetical protein